jgi:uncharacterized MAPEG superfamily protein
MRLRQMARPNAVAESRSNREQQRCRRMSLELTFLIWSVGLTFIQMLIATSGAMLQFGLPELAGNREGLPPATGWVGRAQRAHRNMLENLVLFAVLILVTEVTNRNSATTGLGAQLFFWARLAYAAVYIAGLPWIRTAVWGVSVAGLILIFLQLL